MGHVRLRKPPAALLRRRGGSLLGLEAEVLRLEEYFRAEHEGTGAHTNMGYSRAFLQRYCDMVAIAQGLGAKSLLSVGISFGLPEAYLAATGGLRVVGTDYRSEKTDVYASYAAKRGVSVLQWDIMRDPLDVERLGGPFDLVWCCEVLEHLRIQPELIIPELCSAVRLDGSVLITVPNASAYSNIARLLRGESFVESLASCSRQQIANGQTVFDGWIHVREPGRADVLRWLQAHSPANFTWDVWLPCPQLSLRGRNLKGIAGLALQLCIPQLRETFYCLGRSGGAKA